MLSCSPSSLRRGGRSGHGWPRTTGQSPAAGHRSALPARPGHARACSWRSTTGLKQAHNRNRSPVTEASSCAHLTALMKRGNQLSNPPGAYTLLRLAAPITAQTETECASLQHVSGWTQRELGHTVQRRSFARVARLCLRAERKDVDEVDHVCKPAGPRGRKGRHTTKGT